MLRNKKCSICFVVLVRIANDAFNAIGKILSLRYRQHTLPVRRGRLLIVSPMGIQVDVTSHGGSQMFLLCKDDVESIVASDSLHAPLGTIASTAPPYLLDEPAPICATYPSILSLGGHLSVVLEGS